MILNRQFSTGISLLDKHIGGVRAGDTVLLLASHTRYYEPIVEAGSEFAISNSLPLVRIFGGEAQVASQHSRGSKVFTPSKRNLTKKKFLKELKTFLFRCRPGSYIIVDDLSNFELFRTKGLDQLWSVFAEFAERKSAFVLATAIRSSLSVQSVGVLKDCPTITLDLIEREGKLYCIPLVLKKRYLPEWYVPIRLSLEKGIGKGASQSPDMGYDDLMASLFQLAAEPMVLFDVKGDFRAINSSALQLLGIPENTLRLLKPTELVDAKDRLKVLRFLVKLRRKQRGSTTVGIRTASGKVLTIEINVSPLRFPLCLGILRDSTLLQDEMRKLLRSQNELREQLERLPVAAIIFNQNSILFSNRKAHELFLSEADQFPRTVSELLTPSSSKNLKKRLAASSNDPSSEDIQLVCRRKDSSEFVAIAKLVGRQVDGKRATQMILQDISRELTLVRHLTESESRFRSIVDRSPIPSLILSSDKSIVHANPSFCQLVGLGINERIDGKSLSAFLGEEELTKLDELMSRRPDPKKTRMIDDCKGKKTDGSWINLRITIHPVVDEASKHFILFLEDITEAIMISEKNQREAASFELLKQMVVSTSATTDPGKLLHNLLQTVLGLLSWEIGGVYLTDTKGKEFQLSHHKGFPEKLVKRLSTLPIDEGLGGYAAKTLEPGIFSLNKYPSYLPHRPLFAELGFSKICLLPLVAKEKAVGMLIAATARDRTADPAAVDLLPSLAYQFGNSLSTAKSFKDLREAEARYRSIVETAADTMYVALPSGAICYASPGIEQLTGYSPKEFVKRPSHWLSLVHPDDKKILLERTTRTGESESMTVTEYRVIPRGRAIARWVRDQSSVVRDDHKRITSIVGVIRDITPEREVVEALRKGAKRQSDIINNHTDGLIAFDEDMKCREWNDAMQRLTGIPKDQVLGKLPPPLFGSEHHPDLHQVLATIAENQAIVTEEIEYLPPRAKQPIHLSARFVPVRDENGNSAGVVASFSDITQWKLREHELRESEQILRNVLDSMDDVLMITDLRGTVLQVNNSFLRVLGYGRSEVIGREFPYDWLLEEEMPRFVLWIASLRERTWLHDFDMTWKAKDDRRLSMSMSTTFLRNSLGEPIAMLNIARDISERTRLARDRETRSRQVELINRVISIANQTNDFDTIFQAAMSEILSLVPASGIGVSVIDEQSASFRLYAVHGGASLHKGATFPLANSLAEYALQLRKGIVVSDHPNDSRHRNRASIDQEWRSQVIIPIMLEGRSFGTLNIGSLEPHVFNEDHAEILQPLAQQIGTIIDRIQLFRQVTEDSTYIRNLLDSIDNIVYTVDTEYRILEVNKAFRRFVKESGAQDIREYHGCNLFEILPSEPLKVTMQNVIDQLLDGSVRIFSQEFVHVTSAEERIFQLTINPIVIGGNITGLVVTHADITALKTTERELKQSNEQLLALNEMSTLLGSSFNLSENLRYALPLLQRTLGAFAAAVYVIGKGGDLFLAEQTGLDVARFSSIMRLGQSSSATGEVVNTKQPLYISAAAWMDERISPPNREVLRVAGIHSMAVIPLLSKDNVLGALDIFYNSPHDFNPQERQMLSLVGNQLGTAIENTQLYEELRSQIERLTVLYELSQQLTSTLDIEQIYRVVYENLNQVVPFRRFSLQFYDPEFKTLSTAYQRGSDGEDDVAAPPHSQPIAPGTPEWEVVHSMRPYADADRPILSVPMLSKGSISGIITIQGGVGEHYTETHLRIMESVGHLAAIALEKGKLHEETVQKSLEIQRRNKELDDFTYVVSHDLKEPLISIEGFSRILQADYGETIQAEGKDYLDSMVGASTRMKGLIDDLLMLSRVSKPSESFRPTSTKGIVDEILTDMEFSIRQRNIDVRVAEDLPTVHGNEVQLKVAFRNLIGNAIKFNPSANPMVQIGFQNGENNYYLFYVRDNGIGIDREFHEKIFVIFQRLHRREDYEGTGAGLAIVKKIIETHGGRIWVESEVAKGSTFFFTIPRAHD